MKKLALLLSVVFLAACGGGGGGNSGTAAQTGTGTLTVKISEPVAKRVTVRTDGTPQDWRRVIVTNPSLDGSGTVYQVYKDFNTASPEALTFDLPYTTGYVVEVLDYQKPTNVFSNYSVKAGGNELLSSTTTTKTPYTMVNYGRATFDFTATASVTVTLRDVAARTPSITYPTSIPSSVTPGATYAVSAAFKNASSAPFNVSTWGLKQGTLTGVSTAAPGIFNGNDATGLVGPRLSTEIADFYYGIGVFYAKNSLLLRDPATNRPTEAFDIFRYQTATSGAADVTVAGGTLTIN